MVVVVVLLLLLLVSAADAGAASDDIDAFDADAWPLVLCFGRLTT